jgi:predicted O-methyltransferase YrrM
MVRWRLNGNFSMTTSGPIFHEDWYSDTQLKSLLEAYQRSAGAAGSVVEIGCWEGKSTAALANACAPNQLIAVDTWAGNLGEGETHATVVLARERDVFAAFCHNMKVMTPGNVLALMTTSADFFRMWRNAIRFIHIDASHDYLSVREDIHSALRYLSPGGVICGDDFLSSGMSRHDLQGGVERAVRELLPGFQTAGNFWRWVKDRDA